MFKSKLFFALVLLVIISAIAIYGGLKKRQLELTDNVNTYQIEDKDINSVTEPETRFASITPTARPALEYNTWIPSWGSVSGLNSLQDNQENNPDFKTISPVWYEVKSDGSLITKYPSNKSELLKYLRDENIKVIPAIAMFDHELFTEVLQNDVNLKRHIENIVSTVIANDYDGIDLDYESTKLSDKEKYFEFIISLSKKLNEIDKELVVTVVAKWGEEIRYPSLVETRQVQDWKEIAKYASEIRIMAYDYTFIKASLPGPIAPLDWVRQVADYAVTQAEPNKFSLGIALYAYQWKTSKDNPDFNYVVNFLHNTNGSASADAYQYKQVKDIVNDNVGERSNYEAETLFTYTKGDWKYALSYFSPADVKARVDLAEKYGFKSVTFWRLGNEADQLSLL